VDGTGRCVGVLSATDFVHWAEKKEGAAKETAPPPACFCSEWQVSDVKALPEGAVARYMTADPVLVAPTTTIGELARSMLNAHIHRLIVTDARKRPVGVVSSTDILAAVARAQPGEA
jgi:CBS-domain-containing membrane protein